MMMMMMKGYGAILRWLLIQVRNLLGSFVEIFDRFNYCFVLEICPLVLPFDRDTTPRAGAALDNWRPCSLCSRADPVAEVRGFVPRKIFEILT